MIGFDIIRIVVGIVIIDKGVHTMQILTKGIIDNK